MSLSAARMLADTRRCSVAKRLPPPCAGMPVSVPQALNEPKAIRLKLRAARR